MDYLPYWIFNFHPAYRLTHSAGFCLVPVTATFFFLRKKDEHAGEKTFQAFCAAFSHLLLDSLVAVHPNPLFWPFSYAMIKLPCGPLNEARAHPVVDPDQVVRLPGRPSTAEGLAGSYNFV